jgi:hypothetical protein
MSLISHDQAVFVALSFHIFTRQDGLAQEHERKKLSPLGERCGMTNVTLFSMTRQIAYDPTRTLALGHQNYAPLF